MTRAAADARIIVADDLSANVKLLTRILTRGGYAHVYGTADSSSVLAMSLELQPDIVLLDLHMPGTDGLAILRDLRARTATQPYLPIVVLTGDASSGARRRTLAAGASDFLTKPYDATEVLLRVRNLLEIRRLHLALAAENRTLEQRIQERTEALVESQIEVLERLAAAAEFRDDVTGQHTRRVGRLAATLAALVGLPVERVDIIRRAAPLHEIGKIGVPDTILRKPGPLTEAECEIMKTHTTMGASILSGGGSELVRVAERIAWCHHEWWDGTGYPRCLTGEAIPVEARLVAVADFIDALAHDRPYRRAVPIEEVLAMVHRGAGTQFDPAVVAALGRLDVAAIVRNESTRAAGQVALY